MPGYRGGKPLIQAADEHQKQKDKDSENDESAQESTSGKRVKF
jgi:hypothetical protein